MIGSVNYRRPHARQFEAVLVSYICAASVAKELEKSFVAAVQRQEGLSHSGELASAEASGLKEPASPAALVEYRENVRHFISGPVEPDPATPRLRLEVSEEAAELFLKGTRSPIDVLSLDPRRIDEGLGEIGTELLVQTQNFLASGLKRFFARLSYRAGEAGLGALALESPRGRFARVVQDDILLRFSVEPSYAGEFLALLLRDLTKTLEKGPVEGPWGVLRLTPVGVRLFTASRKSAA